MTKALLRALPRESQQEIDRMTLEDRHRAEEGFVELWSEEGGPSYKHLEQLLPEDRKDRIRAELRRLEWLLERQERRNILFTLGHSAGGAPCIRDRLKSSLRERGPRCIYAPGCPVWNLIRR